MTSGWSPTPGCCCRPPWRSGWTCASCSTLTSTWGRPGRANAADKATLLHSALAGGGWIDDCDRLRAGSTGQLLGHWGVRPSTIGPFLWSFTFGHARQLDAVSGQALLVAGI
jgi:hypothetical protein